MTDTPVNKSGATAGFITLMALTISLTALAIDAMLPALGEIGRDLSIVNDNDRQLILLAVFAGLASAQIIYGPLSDRFGRKPIILLGLIIFAIGSFISALSDTLSVMLFGRLLQGIGAASPRIVIMAIIRDRYKGDLMASITSLMMMVFILVPILAPLLGQGILLVADWRWIFWMFIAHAAVMSIWFVLAQPETLAPENRIAFRARPLLNAAREVVTTPVTVGYTVVGGLAFGCFIGFLTSVQQILQEQYALGSKFPFAFASLAICIGLASLLNSRLVLRFSTRPVIRTSLFLQLVVSGSFLIFSVLRDFELPLWILLPYLGVAIALCALLFGNVQAVAMEPMGHIAGMASSLIGSFRTLLSLIIGGLIGRAYDGSVAPLITGFAVCALMGLLAMLLTERYVSNE